MGGPNNRISPRSSPLDKLQDKKGIQMKPFAKCPQCGQKLTVKNVDKVLRGGNDTAVVTIKAEVCLHCGERLFSADTVKKFEAIRGRLQRRETRGYELVGQTFKVN
jgi:YgiT-type zinc finger domain-containing protein